MHSKIKILNFIQFIVALSFLIVFDIKYSQAMSCRQSPSFKTLSYSKIRFDEERDANRLKSQEIQYYELLKKDSTPEDNYKLEKLKAKALEAVDSMTAEVLALRGVKIDYFTRGSGEDAQQVFYLSLHGKHPLNKLAKVFNRQLQGLRVRVVKDIGSFDRASYSEEYNEIFLPYSKALLLDFTEGAIIEQSFLAFSTLKGVKSFGSLKTLNSEEKQFQYIANPSLGRELNYIQQLEAKLVHLFSNISRFVGVKSDSYWKIIADYTNQFLQSALQIRDLTVKVKNLINDVLLLAEKEEFEIKKNLPENLKASQYYNRELLATAHFRIKVDGVEHLYKLPIYSRDLAEYIEKDRFEYKEGVDLNRIAQEQDSILHARMKEIIRKKLLSIKEYINKDLYPLTTKVVEELERVDISSDKVAAANSFIAIPLFKKFVTEEFGSNEFRNFLKENASPGEEFIRHWIRNE
ncbi:MAG: hypothetical protein VX642_13420 [Bdellovibrionota bacterium]|nr:hypothetical protein [Bdellovibrionota bacterium]